MEREDELDKGIRAKKREMTGLGSGDHDLLHSAQTGEGLIEVTSVEMLKELAKAAVVSHNFFQEMCKVMTQEQAEFVRHLRNQKDYSWRGVAEACFDQNWFNFNLEKWQPPSNQLMGMALCEKAASFYGQNYMEPPWN